MTIQRQYSLPNFRLVLEGFPEDPAAAAQGLAPVMSNLVNVECYVAGLEQPLSGGMDFLNSLVMAVSKYAQAFLSGVPSSEADTNATGGVRLEKIAPDRHRLVVKPADTHSASAGALMQVELTTPQLFDLVEAVDQFLADAGTLPQMRLQLQPVSRKYSRHQHTSAGKVVPLAVGVSGFAVAAIAFFWMPMPEIKRPTEAVPQNSSSKTESPPPETPGGAGKPNDGTSPPPQAQTAADLETLLASVPEITDATELEALKQKLFTEIGQAWKTQPTFGEDLVYQVGLGQDGAILGYKPQSEAARVSLDQTPLKQLLYIPPGGGTVKAESIGLFRVVFTPKGSLEVSPWKGYAAKPSPPPEITDAAVLENLLWKVRDKLTQNWKPTASFPRELVYRVKVTADGTLVDYEAQNQPGYDYVGDTPLRTLHQPSAAVTDNNGAVVQVPVAEYRVVFTPRGVVEISPWKGF
ncbi:MAG TPA: DUF4335 domain-containing protein [Oscillatoriaceae cyanobacterium M33_DOE_052]|uniref:DUF4335 domain-containing protein n=1 Tax=Planktothricoides sp. SpSt-374 TaxID=2282167 RepID=A0A7C3ZJX7_9CYAN|nr:DUF4335 domain-containing protein [Oscillatoriaceae cyanobacterium M33_DOE_052]